MKNNKYEINIDDLKKRDDVYLKELQIFFDKVDCIKDDELKLEILRQMHRCEQRIILMCEDILNGKNKV